MSVTFDHPCTVKKGANYAIVLLSPLSHPTNSYWIGGWNKHCHADVYKKGNAFKSFNCCYTWVSYGKEGTETGEEAVTWRKLCSTGLRIPMWYITSQRFLWFQQSILYLLKTNLS